MAISNTAANYHAEKTLVKQMLQGPPNAGIPERIGETGARDWTILSRFSFERQKMAIRNEQYSGQKITPLARFAGSAG